MKFEEKVRVFTEDIDAAAAPVLRVAKLSLQHQATKMPPAPDRPTESWFDVSVWLEGPDDVRKDVTGVVYTLHPTFNPNVVPRTTPPEFRLRLRVWGAFTVRAEVRFNDGTSINLARFLALPAS